MKSKFNSENSETNTRLPAVGKDHQIADLVGQVIDDFANRIGKQAGRAEGRVEKSHGSLLEVPEEAVCLPTKR